MLQVLYLCILYWSRNENLALNLLLHAVGTSVTSPLTHLLVAAMEYLVSQESQRSTIDGRFGSLEVLHGFMSFPRVSGSSVVHYLPGFGTSCREPEQR